MITPEIELVLTKEDNANLREQLTAEVQNAANQAAALEHVSVKWFQLHAALSEALGLECLPNEDIERYTERIAEMKAALDG